MSVKVVRMVLERSRSRGPARVVLFVLAEHADDHGVAWPSVQTIAREAGLSRRAVFRGLDKLEELGEVERRFKGQRLRNGAAVNLYRVKPPSPDGAKSGTVPEMTPCQKRHSDGAKSGTRTVPEVAPEPSGTTKEPSGVGPSNAPAARTGGAERKRQGVSLDTGEVVQRFPTQAGEWELRRARFETLRQDFPQLDLEAECRRARAWLTANPKRQKTGRGMPRFLASWLGRAMDSKAALDRAMGATSTANRARKDSRLSVTDEHRRNPDLY